MRGGKKPGGAAATPARTLQDAVREAEEKHLRAQRSRKRRKPTGGGATLGSRLRTLLLVIGIPALLLALDGARRELAEFHPRAEELTGQVQVIKAGSNTLTVLKQGESLGVGDVVVTGPRSLALLVLADGSSLRLEPGTRFEIRDLNYSRDGKRNQLFQVRFGSVVARFGRLFGVGSRGAVGTPGAVAAVRGTAFRVAYAPAGRRTLVGVVEGTVTVRSPGSAVSCPTGALASVTGYQIAGG